MKKEQIMQAVRDYVNNDKAKYAVLINGVWGSGKTFFYEHCLKDEITKLENGKNNRKANVYISLYGISSVEQLAKEITTHYIIEVKLRSNKMKEKIYAQISKATGIFSKMVSFSINGLSIDIDKGLEEIKNNIEFKDMVICLDDFERCSIPVNELFGIINNLVEHCSCKVIILADEDNIGKMYANTNIEAKYLTLLVGKSLQIRDEENADKKDKNSNKITVEELKRFNEKIYSENYLYKDIKEKVIGLSLKYEPCLKEEFTSIIEDTVSSPELSKILLSKKEAILFYMDKCQNSNIRIMKMWLMNFERIYVVIENYYANGQYHKYFNDIFDRFTIYTIRVACILGKNKALKEWEDGVEVGNVILEDNFPLNRQGYRFVDDLFIESIFEIQRICYAATFIIKELQDREERAKDLLKRQAYNKLNQWYYLEDDEVLQNLADLKTEIENDEFEPQDYQNIFSMLVVLKQKEFIKEEFIKEIYDILKNKLLSMDGKINIKKFRQDFQEQESLDLYRKYFDALYSIMIENNRKIDRLELNQVLECTSGKEFSNYCYINSDKFLQKRSFVQYINLDKLINIVQTGDVRGIYDIIDGFESVYNFSNLYEYYADDADMLKDLVRRLKEVEYRGRTHKEAVEYLCNTLSKKIVTIESKG